MYDLDFNQKKKKETKKKILKYTLCLLCNILSPYKSDQMLDVL